MKERLAFELHPCPFCGDKDVFFDIDTSQVVCVVCDACGPIGETHKESVKMWNTAKRTAVSVTDKSEIEVESCPFCGDCRTHFDTESQSVICPYCDAYGPEFESKKASIRRWNEISKKILASHCVARQPGTATKNNMEEGGLRTAPKNNVEEGKPRMSLLPLDLLEKHLVPAYEEGILKGYGRESWREGFYTSVMMDAAMRHQRAFFWGGEDYDPDAIKLGIKKHHLAGAIFSLLCILNTLDTRPELDDRPEFDTDRDSI